MQNNATNYILLQYELVLNQLNGQVQKLLQRNQELEQANLSQELVVNQSKQIIAELSNQMQLEKQATEQRFDFVLKQREEVETELEKHKHVIGIFNQELEMLRQQNFELDSRLQMAA